MNNNILLSICIPTYNRAQTLDNSLKNLFTNVEFDINRIEVVVLDNASTDNTLSVIAKYPQVKYWRNTENIRDRTFWKILNYATGKYVKLFNDTLTFKKGILSHMLDILEQNLAEANRLNVFFYDNNPLHCNCFCEIKNKTELLDCASLYTTSIANFGCWRADLKYIIDPQKYWESQFVQVDWSYQLVSKKPITQIYFGDMFAVEVPFKKGGYNVFDTFINKYLYVIKQHKFSLFQYEKEKYRLMRYFIWAWLNSLVIQRDKRFAFDTNRWLNVLLKKYWYELYLYPVLLLLAYKKIKQ